MAEIHVVMLWEDAHKIWRGLEQNWTTC